MRLSTLPFFFILLLLSSDAIELGKRDAPHKFQQKNVVTFKLPPIAAIRNIQFENIKYVVECNKASHLNIALPNIVKSRCKVDEFEYYVQNPVVRLLA